MVGGLLFRLLLILLLILRGKSCDIEISLHQTWYTKVILSILGLSCPHSVRHLPLPKLVFWLKNPTFLRITTASSYLYHLQPKQIWLIGLSKQVNVYNLLSNLM